MTTWSGEWKRVQLSYSLLQPTRVMLPTRRAAVGWTVDASYQIECRASQRVAGWLTMEVMIYSERGLECEALLLKKVRD